MNVGDDKGRIVTNLIADRKPQVMVELGGYIGYSVSRSRWLFLVNTMFKGLMLLPQAVLFGDAVRKAGGKRYFSLERNPEFAAVIMSLVDLAGLSEIVKVVVGSSADSIKRLHAEKSLEHIDLIFLDHYKPAYTTDLKLCEHLKLVTPGSVLAADNVIKPGNPPYLEYVRSSVAKKRDQYKAAKTNGVDIAGFGDRWKNQYQKREGEEKLSTEVKGNPHLLYDSGLVHSFEPTGVPVRVLNGLPLGRNVTNHGRMASKSRDALGRSTMNKMT